MILSGEKVVKEEKGIASNRSQLKNSESLQKVIVSDGSGRGRRIREREDQWKAERGRKK